MPATRKVNRIGNSYHISIPPKFMRVLGIMPEDSVVMVLLPNKILALTNVINAKELLDVGKTGAIFGAKGSL